MLSLPLCIRQHHEASVNYISSNNDCGTDISKWAWTCWKIKKLKNISSWYVRVSTARLLRLDIIINEQVTKSNPAELNINVGATHF